MAHDDFSIFAWQKSEITFVSLVLIIILGVSFFQLKISEMKTRDAQRKSDVELVFRALDSYRGDHGEFPSATSSGQIVSCGDMGTLNCEWGAGPMRDIDGVVYLKQIPQDPLTFKGRHYVYELDAINQKAKVYVALERPQDPGSKLKLTILCGINVQCNWYVGN